MVVIFRDVSQKTSIEVFRFSLQNWNILILGATLKKILVDWIFELDENYKKYIDTQERDGTKLGLALQIYRGIELFT